MTEEPHDRLRQARIDAKFKTAKEAAEAMGIKSTTYTHHENGTRGIAKDDAIIYAKKFKVSPVWILFGTNVVELKSREAARQADTRNGSSTVNEMDVRAGAGSGGVLDATDYTDETGSNLSRDAVLGQWEMPDYFLRGALRVDPSKVIIMEVFGDSGYDPSNSNAPGSIYPGDRVIVDTNDKRPSPSGAFAVYDGIGIVVKLVEPVYGSDPPRVRLSSRNPTYSPYEVTLEEGHIIGRVRGRITVM
jgi:phage repressor protein C with HTH and peptisase S24 domain